MGAVLRPALRPDGREIVTLLRRLIARIRGHWPRVEILLRGDSHYCTPEVLRFCRANRVDYALGVATTTTLRRHIDTLEQSTAARFAAAGGPDCPHASRDARRLEPECWLQIYRHANSVVDLSTSEKFNFV